MSTIKELIVVEHFNTSFPYQEMFVNVNNFGQSPDEVKMIIEYMEDDMYITISRRTQDVFGITPTERGAYHFKNILISALSK